VAAQVADRSGVLSFSLLPGNYDVSFKVAEKSWGTFSGVTVDPKDKNLKMPVTILKATPQ
jgi:hypothetical protein